MRRPEAVDHWGSTLGERNEAFGCDPLLPDFDTELFRAADVEAPPEITFRWVCQLRVAPYSYDVLDNLGRRSPQELIPGVDRLEIGQRFMTMFQLVAFEPGRSITLWAKTRRFGQLAVTYRVDPVGEEHSRIVVKILSTHPSTTAGRIMQKFLPWGDVVMMRRQLLNLRQLAERTTPAKVEEVAAVEPEPIPAPPPPPAGVVVSDGWVPFEAGLSVGEPGPEGGDILREHEHEEGARITLEGVYYGRDDCRISVNVHDNLLHVHAVSEAEADARYAEMQAALDDLLQTITFANTGTVWLGFVQRFPGSSI